LFWFPVYHKNLKYANIYSKNVFDFFLTFENASAIIRKEQTFETYVPLKERSDMRERERKIRNSRLKKHRKLRKHRKNILLTMLAILCVLSMSLCMGGVLSRADDGALQQEDKRYTSVVVGVGDTLWSIAETHRDAHYASVEEYIEEIRQINCLRDDDIKSGTYLIIPYYVPAPRG